MVASRNSWEYENFSGGCLHAGQSEVVVFTRCYGISQGRGLQVMNGACNLWIGDTSVSCISGLVPEAGGGRPIPSQLSPEETLVNSMLNITL